MRSPSASDVRHDLVLVGGGHAHIQVLTRWAMEPVPGARLTLVVDRPLAVYSGMVPGFVAGQYSREDLEIDVRPLALRAGARCIVAPATGLDTGARLRSNGSAARAMVARRPAAATDVTGFGLAGHLGEMLRASKGTAVLDLAAIPALPGAVALLGRGIRSTGHPENARARRAMLVEPDAARRDALDLLFDPQTSGGLLLAVPRECSQAMLSALRDAGDGAAAIIGEVAPPRPDGALIRVVATEVTRTPA